MMPEPDFLSQRLSETPDLPPNLYDGVVRTIRHKQAVARAVQMCVVVAALGLAGSFLGVRAHSAAQQERAELNAELESMQTFVNGSNLQEEYAQYTLVSDQEW